MISLERTAILGASRGLGFELVGQAIQFGEVLAVSRKIELAQFSIGNSSEDSLHRLRADFSHLDGQNSTLSRLGEFRPTKVFYVAGGGPYGRFIDKNWSAHEWGLQVTFLFAAQVVNFIFKNSPKCQIILVGSSVAEDGGDSNAASYSAAKHALVGLYRSIHLESPELDLRLISPGYMDTDMLPKSAEVRKKGVWSPKIVAQEVWSWSQSPDVGGHKVYEHHPSC